MPFTVEEWLTGVVGGADKIPDAERQVILKHLGSEAAAKSLQEQAAGSLRQEDYSRQMNAFKREKDAEMQKITELRQKAVNSYGALTQWKDGVNQQLLEANQKVEEIQAREKSLREGFVKAAKEFGFDPKEVGVDPAILSPMDTDWRPAPANGGGGGGGGGGRRQPAEVGLTAEQITDQMRQMESRQAAWAVEVADIAARHRSIFGTEPELTPVLKKAMEQGRPLEDVWSEAYGVPAKLQERATSDFEAKVKERVDAEMKVKEQELVQRMTRVPGSISEMPHSPVLGLTDRENRAPEGDTALQHHNHLAKAAQGMMERFATGATGGR